MPFPLGSVHAYQLDVQSLLALGVLIIDMLRELHSGGEGDVRYVTDKILSILLGYARIDRIFLESAWYEMAKKKNQREREDSRESMFSHHSKENAICFPFFKLLYII